MYPRTLRKKIGELLIERQVITPEQLEFALNEQRQKGGYISQHLIALKFASEQDIAVCLSNQYNFAYLPLKHYAIPTDVLRLVPFKWIRIYTLIPVDKLSNSLSVAMADPLNEGVIEMLQQVTNHEIRVFVSTYSEINEAIGFYFKDEISKTQDATIADVNKLAVMGDFIRTKGYSGAERRKYIRVSTELDFEYAFRGKSARTRTCNVSFGGVCFLSPVVMPVDLDLTGRLYLNAATGIDCVVRVLRVQGLESEGGKSGPYEVAGVFEFMADDDKVVLAEFLKEHIASSGQSPAS